MIKIFSSGKTVCLLNNFKGFELKPGRLKFSISSVQEMTDIYHQFISNVNAKELFFCDREEETLFDWFKSMFKMVEAAGGLVKNETGEYLFIFRNGKWDLPKGKIEKGESIEIAAVREVEEECGIQKLSIIKKMNPTFHTYTLNGKHILKPTYWFEMYSDDQSVLKPQTEEGITEVRWVASEDLKMIKKNTYESILDVIEGIK